MLFVPARVGILSSKEGRGEFESFSMLAGVAGSAGDRGGHDERPASPTSPTSPAGPTGPGDQYPGVGRQNLRLQLREWDLPSQGLCLSSGTVRIAEQFSPDLRADPGRQAGTFARGCAGARASE